MHTRLQNPNLFFDRHVGVMFWACHVLAQCGKTLARLVKLASFFILFIYLFIFFNQEVILVSLKIFKSCQRPPLPCPLVSTSITSNHSYTHCNLDVHPLDPPTMWAITTLWWSVLLPCTLFINNLVTNHHCDNSHLHRLWRHDTFVCLFTLHVVPST